MKKVLLFLLVWLLPVGLFAQQGDNNQQKALVFTPVVNHNAHIGRIDNAVSVEVNDRNDRRLPKVGPAVSARSAAYIVVVRKIQRKAVG